MITIGIETSCDETSVSVLKDDRKILSNIVYSSLKEHKEFGGVVPEIASRSHVEYVLECIDAALKKAKISLKDIDLVAVTQGPGLMGSILVGFSAAKALAFSLKKPLIGVDHVIAHIYSGFLSENVGARRAVPLRFPVLGLVVSGGHTLLIKMTSPARFEILGRTRDDAAGEAFDKVAKILGLGYPGGPEIDRLSRGGTCLPAGRDPKRTFFTRPFLANDSSDFSFSGIKTAVFYHVEKLKKKKPLTLRDKKEICVAFQEAVCDTLVQKSLRTAKKHGLKTLVVGGGVSANSRLKQKLNAAAKREGLKVVFPSAILCQDNAAMIAGLGHALYKEGKRDSLEIAAYSDFCPKR